MKEMFTINDTLTNKISYYHTLAFLMGLPFDRFYSELVLISWLLHELIHLKKKKLSGIRMPLMMTSLLYLVVTISTIYSADKEQAFKDLQVQLAFLLFPLIFSVTSLDIRKYSNRLLKAFTLICLITILYLYFDAFRIIRYNKLPFSTLISNSFINHNFSLALQLHATVLSMYITLAAGYLLHRFIHSDKARERLVYAGGLLILAAGIFQLSSKAVFIATLIIINILFPLLMLKRQTRWKFMLVSFLVSALVITGITQIPTFKERYIAGSRNDLNEVSVRNDLLEPRLMRWQAALKLVQKAPLIGYGTGTEKKLLKEKYFENRLFNSYVHELDAHNQYLSFLIRTGIIGLFVYLLVLFVALKRALQTADLVFCVFVTIIAIVSFSENILNFNKGIFFFNFFYCFFIKANEKYINNAENPTSDQTPAFN